MRSAIALVLGQPHRSRLSSVLREEVTLRFCARREEVQPLLLRYGATAVFTELVDVAGASTKPVLAVLHERIPEIPVFVLHPGFAIPAKEILELGTLGVRACLSLAAPDLATSLRDAIARAEQQNPQELIMRVVRQATPPGVRRFFQLSARPLQTNRLQQELRRAGIPPRTLRDRLARAGLPSPRRIAAWCRLLHVAWRLDLSRRPVKAVAAELGYPSDVALRNHLKRHTGLRVKELLDHGGFRFLLRRFEQELRD